MAWLVLAVRVMMLSAVVIPAIAFGIITVDLRDEAQREAETVIGQRAAFVAEHVARVIEAQETLLDHIDLMTRDLTWDEIERGHTGSLMLKNFADRIAPIASAWMADTEGVVRAGSIPWRPGLRIDDRDFFVEQRAEDRGTFIGEAFVGRTTGLRSFGISRRRSAADGSFAGTIHVAVAVEHFERFFASIPGRRQVAVLVRADGLVLARSPPLPEPIRLPAASSLTQRIAHADHGIYWGTSTIDGMDRLFGFQRVGSHPLYVGFGIDSPEIFAAWRDEAMRYGLLTAVLILLLTAAGFGLLALVRRAAAASALALEQTERNAEAQRRIDALERQNAVTRVVAGVAHEFNNLLTPILMGAEMLRERAADATDRHTLDSMVEGAERGGRLVAALLSHIQNQFLRIERVAPQPAVEETLAECRAGLSPGINLVLDAAHPLPEILADRRQLQLALSHLLDNAQRATRDGGMITVRLAALADGPIGGWVLIAVEDAGIGMTPEILAQAREPFFTTALYRERPGLGLAMVSGFVGQLGGTLTIDSRPGRGTRVEMRLPVAPD